MIQTLERVARAFIAHANTRGFDRDAVKFFFEEQGVSVDFVLLNYPEEPIRPDDELMMVVHLGGKYGVGIPPIRVGMLRLNVSQYFDLVRGYNGIDPIYGPDVVDLSELLRGSDGWKLVKKGIIQGH